MKTLMIRRVVLVLLLLLFMGAYVPFSSPSAVADIYRWDNGELITTKDAEPSADFSRMDLSYADLVGANLADADFYRSTLTSADFTEANLTRAYFRDATLTSADFTEANLAYAEFREATLTDADFTGAVITGASFHDVTIRGFTAEQFYSTASYQSGDLGGIGLGAVMLLPRGNDLSGWNFAGKNLTAASFSQATLAYANFAGANLTHASFSNADLTSADFTEAIITGASLGSTGFTADQLYSTASYQSGDLRGIRLDPAISFFPGEPVGSDLSGWDLAGKNLTGAHFDTATLVSTNFAGANLTNASFGDATLTDADLRGAHLTNADFLLATLTNADLGGANLTNADFRLAALTDADLSGTLVTGVNFSGSGFTAAQLYSTASYQDGDLSGIGLGGGLLLRDGKLFVFRGQDLSGWDFAGKNLTNADFSDTTLTDTDLSGANLTNVDFRSATLTSADFTGAILTGADFNDVSLPLHLPMLPVVDSVKITDPRFTTDSIVIYPGGRLEIIPPEFTIDCDVVFRLDDSGSGLIETNGISGLHPDSTLELVAERASFFKAGTYTLIEAQGIDGTFGSFTGLGEYATVEDLTYTDTALTVTIDKDLLPADANLDMQTDLPDFNIWNANKFTTGTGWTGGDFNGDGQTDLSDFNIWNAYKFTVATGGAAPVPTEVPEPGTLGLLGCALAIGLARRRWRRAGWCGLGTTDEYGWTQISHAARANLNRE